MQSIREVSALIIAGSICLALGAVAVLVPVLPTTPFVLLAAFLYSRSSSRLNSWLASTSIYRAYVEPVQAERWDFDAAKAQNRVGFFRGDGHKRTTCKEVDRLDRSLAAVAVFLLVLTFGQIPDDFQRGGAQLWSSHRRIAGQVCLW